MLKKHLGNASYDKKQTAFRQWSVIAKDDSNTSPPAVVFPALSGVPLFQRGKTYLRQNAYESPNSSLAIIEALSSDESIQSHSAAQVDSNEHAPEEISLFHSAKFCEDDKKNLFPAGGVSKKAYNAVRQKGV